MTDKLVAVIKKIEATIGIEWEWLVRSGRVTGYYANIYDTENLGDAANNRALGDTAAEALENAFAIAVLTELAEKKDRERYKTAPLDIYNIIEGMRGE